ncbi:hypothetical protein GGR21_002099 [Dysgonomonas hofstadii]|uniref:Uncharacterized protein n=1 Tax=Dysgonomonas hofstadii TaxID=637886 RepID=A0A840CQ46_9BACT|nr:hypothetical protein [Dysgonomonas hofstadii]MBB4036198.1 hypothetical protein [Dysgonomonas hofstadii]
MVGTLKVRASYGELGNQNTTSWYPTYQTMSVNASNGTWLINGAKPNTAYAPGLASSLLTWERIKICTITLFLLNTTYTTNWFIQQENPDIQVFLSVGQCLYFIRKIWDKTLTIRQKEFAAVSTGNCIK